MNRSCRVYVGNLAYKTSWQTLKDHFRQSGDVLRAEIFEDRSGRAAPAITNRPVSKGCGVVEFATATEARRAIDELMDSELDGRKIFVREDREETGDRRPPPRGGDFQERERWARPGDWPCPVCRDLQFARNTTCRKCGEPRPGRSATPSRSRSRSPLPPPRGASRGGERPRVGGVGNFMPGDWACPSCGDHQFAKNMWCRKCNEPKPQASGAGAGAEGGSSRSASPAPRLRRVRRVRRVRREPKKRRHKSSRDKRHKDRRSRKKGRRERTRKEAKAKKSGRKKASARKAKAHTESYYSEYDDSEYYDDDGEEESYDGSL